MVIWFGWLVCVLLSTDSQLHWILPAKPIDHFFPPRFHGHPGLCQLHDQPAACCIHGAPTFPHWHRLYMEHMENALLAHGSAVSMPYWDFTEPISELPALFRDATFYNSRSQSKEPNPFFRSVQNESRAGLLSQEGSGKLGQLFFCFVCLLLGFFVVVVGVFFEGVGGRGAGGQGYSYKEQRKGFKVKAGRKKHRTNTQTNKQKQTKRKRERNKTRKGSKSEKIS